MHLFLHGRSINYDQWYPVSDLSGLQVTWDLDLNERISSKSGLGLDSKAFYTLVIYDIDAPREEQHSSSPFVHLLVTNIPGNDVSKGVVLAPLMLPSPLRGSGEHRYIIDLYRQSISVQEPAVTIHRRRFPVTDFVTRHGLTRVETDVFVVDPNTMMFYFRSSAWQSSFSPQHPLIKADSGLSEGEAKFCSCVVDVAVKNPEECNIQKAWPNKLSSGEKCYSPYQVCAKSVGTTSHSCYSAYNYNEFSETQLHALANLTGVIVSPTMSRDAVVNAIISHPIKRHYA